jgi:hypothetical protein
MKVKFCGGGANKKWHEFELSISCLTPKFVIGCNYNAIIFYFIKQLLFHIIFQKCNSEHLSFFKLKCKKSSIKVQCFKYFENYLGTSLRKMGAYEEGTRL